MKYRDTGIDLRSGDGEYALCKRNHTPSRCTDTFQLSCHSNTLPNHSAPRSSDTYTYIISFAADLIPNRDSGGLNASAYTYAITRRARPNTGSSTHLNHHARGHCA